MKYIEHCAKMAKAAAYAYLDEDEGEMAFAELGYTNHAFIEKDGAQCHVVWNEDEFVIAFRGTEPDEFSDIKADLNAWPDRGESGGWVHNGFQEEVNKLWNQIQFLLRHEVGRDFFITGHSLGGAMATIAASRLKDSVEALYTYGSPRAGTRSFVKSFNVPHYRHVNNNDIVPSVPFAFLGYRHHGTLRYINFYGNIRKMTPWQRIKDKWRGRTAALKKGQPFDGVYDHGMHHYVKYTEKNQ
jgi:triacylglycerol lipase